MSGEVVINQRVWRWHWAMIAGIACVSALALGHEARAERALIAVASNFDEGAARFKRAVEASTPHQITITLGSTGKLYAQIVAGAPFDVFLAADQERPSKLVADGAAVAGSQFTYAVGQLSLWTADASWPTQSLQDALLSSRARVIAIANPPLAPYGKSAKETLEALSVWDSVQTRLVIGQNIGQTFGLIATGNSPIGFVARTQLQSARGKAFGGRRWDVPSDLHTPIRQDAVLLKRARTNAAALAWLTFARSANARAILADIGYKAAKD